MFVWHDLIACLKWFSAYNDQQNNYFINVLYVNLQYFEEQFHLNTQQIGHLLQGLYILQDLNLDLEVENYNYMRDLSLLETRLLKYQHDYKVNESKTEIKKLLNEKLQYENVIGYLKEEMHTMSEHLGNLHDILSASNANTMQESSHLNETLNQLQIVNTQLQQKLMEEMEANEVNVSQISELEQIISEKNVEINQAQELYEIRRQLQVTVGQNADLQSTIEALQDDIRNIATDSGVSDSHSAKCQKEIGHCQCILRSLKEKLGMMKGIIEQKSQEIAVLQSNYDIQNETLINTRKDCEDMKRVYNQDIADLRHTVKELNDKLNKNETNLLHTQESLKLSQDSYIDLERRSKCIERQLTDKINQLRGENDSSREKLSHAEQDILNMQQLLQEKETQLNNSRASKSCAKSNAKLTAALQEVSELKSELNNMLQAKNKLAIENEKLRVQVCQLRGNITAYQERSQLAAEQLEQSIIELQSMQAEKESLETKNENLTQELLSQQSAMIELSREHHSKCKSLQSMEVELSTAQLSRNEVCMESRCVIESVRMWLAEQKNINESLSKKIKDQDNMIAKLKREKQELMIKLQKSSTNGSCSCRSQSNLAICQNSPDNRTFWSLGSHGSSRSSPDSCRSAEYQAGSDEDGEHAGELPYVWLHRVESMTDELQRSSLYWQNRMNENDYMVTRDQ